MARQTSPEIGISVIMPTLDEGGTIGTTLESLAPLRWAGGEIIVVDGGSRDHTVARAEPLADRVLQSTPGRATQMNAGAAVARGDILWFLHADTRVDTEALTDLDRAAADPGFAWGRFGVRLSGRRPLFRLIGTMINVRSCVTGIATGDQGLCMRRSLFESAGGFPDIPLMEDVALSKALRMHARPRCLPVRLTTSSRRWERNGPWRTIWQMWALRWAYWRGADPAELARRYRGEGSPR